MLPRDRRIQKKDFSYILKNAKRINSPHFTLFTLKDLKVADQKSRFAFSVSKKVAKQAVLRNKLRRRGYSVISMYLKNIQNNQYFIFVFKKGAENTTFKSLKKEIEGLLAVYFD